MLLQRVRLSVLCALMMGLGCLFLFCSPNPPFPFSFLILLLVLCINDFYELNQQTFCFDVTALNKPTCITNLEPSLYQAFFHVVYSSFRKVIGEPDCDLSWAGINQCHIALYVFQVKYNEYTPSQMMM